MKGTYCSTCITCIASCIAFTCSAYPHYIQSSFALHIIIYNVIGSAEHPLPLACPFDAPPPCRPPRCTASPSPSARPPLRGHHHTTGVLYSAYNTIQCTHNTIHIKYNRTRYNTRQYDTIRYDTIRYDTIRHNRIRYDNIYDNIRSARPMTISLAAR